MQYFFNLLKTIIAFIFFSLFSISIAAQRQDEDPKYDNLLKIAFPELNNRFLSIDCTPISTQPNCNFISNNNFTPTTPGVGNGGLDPFTLGYVQPWVQSHGTPMLGLSFPYVSPPVPATGYAMMSSYAFSPFYPNPVLSEGIAQKIPALSAGQSYILSFFRRILWNGDPQTTPPDGPTEFNIVLTNCNTFNSQIQTNTYLPPVIPSQSQKIYCETLGTAIYNGWQRIVIKFTPNSNYDVIWFFPKDIYGAPYSIPGPTLVAYPELVKIDAGISPNPTPNNCTVSIGPSIPNCSVYNSTYTWYGPQGQIIPASLNQQLSVNAQTEYGIWKLRMNVPNRSITNNLCSPGELEVQVNVPACTEYWPKVYSTGDGFYGIMKDNTGNIIASMWGLHNNTASYYNHVGAFPSADINSPACIQFTSSGNTNWYLGNGYQPYFAFQSGIVQVGKILNGGVFDSYYINGTTGITVSPPFSIPLNERVVAETINGTIITIINQTLKVYASSGNSSMSLSANSSFYQFNRSTNTIYILEDAGINYSLKVFQFNGTTLGTPSVFSYNNLINAIVANNNNFYYLNNGVLMQYNYTNGTSSGVSVAGLNNQNLNYVTWWEPYRYTKDKITFFNNSDNYLYLVDFASMTSKKIFTTNFQGGVSVIENDDVYIAGDNWIWDIVTNSPTPIGIGSQNVPVPLSFHIPFFITKLSLQNDFSRQLQGKMENSKDSQMELKISLAPNPSNNIINVKVLKNDNVGKGNYTFFITNRTGNVVWTCRNCPSFIRLDVSKWEKGVYHIEAVSARNEKIVVPFLKM